MHCVPKQEHGLSVSHKDVSAFSLTDRQTESPKT